MGILFNRNIIILKNKLMADKFKQLFISNNNSSYIMNIVKKKLANQKGISLSEQQYWQNLIDIQNNIFDNYFVKIYSDLQNSDNFTLENVLVSLNKLTISNLEYIISNKLLEAEQNQMRNQQISITDSSNISKNNIQSKISKKEPKVQKKQVKITENKNEAKINVIIKEVELKVNQEVELKDNQEVELKDNQEDELKVNQEVNQEDELKDNQEVNQEVELKDNQEANQEVNQEVKKVNVEGDKKVNREIKTKTKEKVKMQEDNYISKSYHFFSGDSIFVDDKYIFDFELKNVKSFCLDKIKIDCNNLYNITLDNNKFIVFENEKYINVKIPVGYYPIKQLLNCIENILNKESPNNNKYEMFIDDNKNKIYIKCNNNDGIPYNFNIKFPNNTTSNYNIQQILGFIEFEYMNNNMYVSETHPIENIYEEIYIKLYLNNVEIVRSISSKRDFCYFYSFDLDLNKYFGKKYIDKCDTTDEYCLTENLDVKIVGFEFLDSSLNPIETPIDFEVLMLIEHIL